MTFSKSFFAVILAVGVTASFNAAAKINMVCAEPDQASDQSAFAEKIRNLDHYLRHSYAQSPEYLEWQDALNKSGPPDSRHEERAMTNDIVRGAVELPKIYPTLMTNIANFHQEHNLSLKVCLVDNTDSDIALFHQSESPLKDRIDVLVIGKQNFEQSNEFQQAQLLASAARSAAARIKPNSP